MDIQKLIPLFLINPMTTFIDFPHEIIDIIFEYRPILGFNVSKKYDAASLTFQSIETVDQYLVMIRRSNGSYIHYAHRDIDSRPGNEIIKRLKFENFKDMHIPALPCFIISMIIDDRILCPLHILYLIRDEYRPKKNDRTHKLYRKCDWYKHHSTSAVTQLIEEYTKEINIRIKHHKMPVNIVNGIQIFEN